MTALNEPSGGTPPLLSTPGDISAAITELSRGTGPFAIDTERAHGIRYSNRAYLIQIKRTGGGLHLIDPINAGDFMADLAEVLASDEWILHSADQDLPCLAMEGLRPPALFDTEMAALLLGEEKTSLQGLLDQELDIQLAKEHSNSDWSARPLAPELLAYAALDVELLIELRDKLLERLEKAGRADWMRQECEHIRLAPPKPEKVDPWRKIATAAKVKDEQKLAIVRELWNVRDDLARAEDIAPGKIIAQKAFVDLVAHLPESKKRLSGHSAFRRRSSKKYVDPIWEAIRAGAKSQDLPPRRLPTTGIPDTRYWAKLNPDAAKRWDVLRPVVLERAEEMGLRQEVLLKPAIQKQGAWDGWSTLTEATHVLSDAGARPWQIEELAPALPHRL